MKVYEAISKVQAELAKTGIAKSRDNTQGTGYKFRGIDDVYNALAPLLSQHGLCILPRMVKREMTERTSKGGGTLICVTVEAEFDFVAVEDGSKHIVRTFGEAMDSGDKATNKAMSAAYKYACFQAFAIPIEGTEDADSSTHELEQPSYDEAVEAYAEDFKLLTENLDDGDFDKAYEIYAKIPDGYKRAVWVAPTKLPPDVVPVYTTKHRTMMQTDNRWAAARTKYYESLKKVRM